MPDQTMPHPNKETRSNGAHLVNPGIGERIVFRGQPRKNEILFEK
jgi:hypothetical protein